MELEKWRDNPRNPIDCEASVLDEESKYSLSLMSFLCKVVPWNLEIALKAMGLSTSSCQACCLPMYGRLVLQGGATGAICWPEKRTAWGRAALEKWVSHPSI